MNIEWYGHAAFKITTEKGTRIIIDPYESGFSDGALPIVPLTTKPTSSLQATITETTTTQKAFGGNMIT